MRFLTLLAAVALQSACLAAAAPSNLVARGAGICDSDCRIAEQERQRGGACGEVFKREVTHCVLCVQREGTDLDDYPELARLCKWRMKLSLSLV